MPIPIRDHPTLTRAFPAFAGAAAFLLAASLIGVLLPNLMDLFADAGVRLPASTTTIIHAAFLVQFIVTPAILGVIAMVLACRRRAPAGMSTRRALTDRTNRRVARAIEAALLLVFASSVALATAALLNVIDAVHRG